MTAKRGRRPPRGERRKRPNGPRRGGEVRVAPLRRERVHGEAHPRRGAPRGAPARPGRSPRGRRRADRARPTLFGASASPWTTPRPCRGCSSPSPRSSSRRGRSRGRALRRSRPACARRPRISTSRARWTSSNPPSRATPTRREAGIAILPGTGFDVVPSDCLAKALSEALPGATSLTLAFRGFKSSAGTMKTMVESLPKGGLARVDGRLVRVPAAWKTMEMPFSDKPRLAMTIPWGDLSTAFRSTGIPNIEVYMAVPPSAVSSARRMRRLAPLLGLSFVQSFLVRRIEKRVVGPTAEERATRALVPLGACRERRAVRHRHARNARGLRAHGRDERRDREARPRGRRRPRRPHAFAGLRLPIHRDDSGNEPEDRQPPPESGASPYACPDLACRSDVPGRPSARSKEGSMKSTARLLAGLRPSVGASAGRPGAGESPARTRSRRDARR